MPLKADVIVIGGGSTGAGIARDLALRGLEPLLLERNDLASGATGACQGAFCAYKGFGILSEMEKLGNPRPNEMLKDFLERRWRGVRPVVEGDQFREEQLTEEIYTGIFNLDKDRPPTEETG